MKVVRFNGPTVDPELGVINEIEVAAAWWEPGNGHHYAITASTDVLHPGQMVVAVLSPFNASYSFQRSGFLADSYVHEKLLANNPRGSEHTPWVAYMVGRLLERPTAYPDEPRPLNEEPAA